MWFASGADLILLTGLMLVAAKLSVGNSNQTWLAWGSLVCYVLAGGVYAISLLLVRQFTGTDRAGLAWVLVVAIAMRLIGLSFPVLAESDCYRYMFDGAVTANGLNPYQYSPRQVIEGTTDNEPLETLAAQAGPVVMSRISHPHLRTIYPPLAQGLFAAAYYLSPFNPGAWAGVLLCLDLLTALILVGLLRSAGLSLLWLCAYLWNPLLVIETYFHLHMDIALGVCLAGFIWALWRGRSILAGLVLAGGVGLKLWPMVLAPLLLGRFITNWRKCLLAAVAAGTTTAIIMLAFLPAFGQISDSGMTAYASNWLANSFAFDGIERLCRIFVTGDASQTVARFISIGLIMAFSIFQARRASQAGVTELARSAIAVICVMLVLGPTVYPWYFLPLAALGGIAPWPIVGLCALLLPVTHLPRDLPGRWFIIACVHIPIWLALAKHTLNRLKIRRSPKGIL